MIWNKEYKDSLLPKVAVEQRTMPSFLILSLFSNDTMPEKSFKIALEPLFVFLLSLIFRYYPLRDECGCDVCYRSLL
jgi:hypothetical protein